MIDKGIIRDISASGRGSLLGFYEYDLGIIDSCQ